MSENINSYMGLLEKVPHIVGWVVAFFLGSYRHRLIDIKNDSQELITLIEDIAENASTYWLSPPSNTDSTTEASLERKLHKVAVESNRLHGEYGLFSKDKILKYNQFFLEDVTVGMSNNRSPNRQVANRIGRRANLYISYIKICVSKKTRWKSLLTLFSK